MGWSDMFHELLDIIAQKHIAFYEDYFSFACVCKSWHSSALEAATESHYLNGPPSRFPSLMLAEKKEEDGEFRELFLLSNKSIRKIRLPEAYGKLCMSSCGWLATVGEDNGAKLINPLSHEIINLPNLDTFPDYLESSVWDNGISKLLYLTNPSSLVVVLWGCSSKLGFCRIGDNKWTHVDEGWGGLIYDITYYNGRVYSFDCKSYIRVCDVYGEDPTIMTKVSRLTKDVYNDVEVDGAYIIGMDGDNERRRLLVVIRKGMFDDVEDPLSDETYMTKSFQVCEYDLENEKWSKVTNLGKKTLFVGYSSSFWIEDTTGVIKANCIYYTDDVFDCYRGSIKGGGRDMGIYHLSDGTIEPHFSGESRSLLTPPIWLQSL